MRTNDYIKITNMRVYAYHGVLPEEKENGQEFFLNAKVYVDMRKAGLTDDLEDTLNYDRLCVFLQEIFKEKTFDLIEAAAEYPVSRFEENTSPPKSIAKALIRIRIGTKSPTPVNAELPISGI